MGSYEFIINRQLRQNGELSVPKAILGMIGAKDGGAVTFMANQDEAVLRVLPVESEPFQKPLVRRFEKPLTPRAAMVQRIERYQPQDNAKKGTDHSPDQPREEKESNAGNPGHGFLARRIYPTNQHHDEQPPTSHGQSDAEEVEG